MKNIQYYIAIVVISAVLPVHAFAMFFFFESDHSMYGVGDMARIDVYLDTNDTIINTISGEIIIETNTFSVNDIIDGNSSVLFWVDKPVFNADTQSVVFSGISPGGISGDTLFLFSIEGTMMQTGGGASFEVKDGIVLLHDGEGTQQSVSFIPKTIFVSADNSTV